MSFSDFTLLPADDPQGSPDEELAGAVAGALAISDPITPAPEDPLQPLGRSWDFDWTVGQFRRVGQSPAETTEFDTLAQWCYAAIYSARYAHPIFSDEFGMEKPDSLVGSLVTGEAISDWQRHLVDALMVHDRISSVENITLDWDPTSGILTIKTLDVITDEDASVTLSDVTLQTGGP